MSDHRTYLSGLLGDRLEVHVVDGRPHFRLDDRSFSLPAEEARRLGSDLLAMFPEPAYRVGAIEDHWDVERVSDDAWIASFVDVADAREFCDAKNAEAQS